MNTTIRNLVLALPLATAALTIAPGAAMAQDPSPIIVATPVDPGDPQPEPQPQPQGPGDIAIPDDGGPQGPGDIANPEPEPQPQPDGPDDIANPEGGGPDGPGDIANPDPEPQPQPDGPDDIANPQPCPTHGSCGGGDVPTDEPADEPTDDPKDADEPKQVHQPKAPQVQGADVPAPDVVTPTRIDAGVAPTGDGGLELAWMLAGGGLVTASGIAFAARKRRQLG